MMHVAMLNSYIGDGAYYPEGGGQMLAATLLESLLADGGELRTRTRVVEIIVTGGRVTGVRLANGEVIKAPVVVSNADYRRTMFELVGTDRLPPVARLRAGRVSMALPLVTLYLAVDGDVDWERRANLWWYASDDIDGIFDRLTEFQQVEMAFLSSSTVKTGSRDGRHNIEVCTVCPPGFAPWGVDERSVDDRRYRSSPDYRRIKKRVTEELLDVVEKAIGPVRGRLAHVELSTPVTHARFTLSTGGTPYGLAATAKQAGMWRPGHRTEINGLYVTGASTRNGPGISATMVGGVTCAEEILGEKLLTPVVHGSTIADPGRLPDRPPGWNPTTISRGRRRDARVH